jgi:REP element-mobilizing transposase RayT
MPRMTRLNSPGSLVHIIARGIDGVQIFFKDEDRAEFLSRLSALKTATQYKCLAWCLMDNHYHLFMRTNDVPMSKLMRPLNGGYARWFNKKYQRRGYLFQDRYKSILCQDLEYARQLLRYIHLNPLRGGKVRTLKELKTWQWCGHGFLSGISNKWAESLQDRKESLRRFGASESEAIRNYLEFLEQGIVETDLKNAGRLSPADTAEVEGSFKGWPAVIGDPDYVKAAMEKHAIGLHRKHRKADYGAILEKLSNRICEQFKLQRNDLLIRGRRNARSEARSAFCFRASREELIPHSVIAHFLHVTIPTVSFMIARCR